MLLFEELEGREREVGGVGGVGLLRIGRENSGFVVGFVRSASSTSIGVATAADIEDGVGWGWG